MSRIRRPGASLDTRRFGQALSFPGIDPRLWVSTACVDAVHVDAANGPFIDATLLPSGMSITARVGSPYAGSGWGLHAPLAVDDEVVVVIPDGDCTHGAVVVARLWAAADPPPAIAAAAKTTNDPLLQAQPGTTLRLVADKIELEAAGGTQALVRGTDYRKGEAKMNQTLQQQLAALATASTALATAMTALGAACSAPPLTPLAANFTAAATAATNQASAATAAAQALGTFEGSAATYLDQNVVLP
jgi:uncharacterized protein involved in type VI secretion and phage assembly